MAAMRILIVNRKEKKRPAFFFFFSLLIYYLIDFYIMHYMVKTLVTEREEVKSCTE